MPKCSICKKNRLESELFDSEFGRICQECIRITKMYIKKGKSSTASEAKIHIPLLKPHEVKQKLDEHIIGQEDAKIALSVEVSRHLKRAANPDLKFRKSNIFLIGPSGTGKTCMVEALASFIHVPLVTSDATTFTEAGYIGKDVSACLLQLLEKTNYDVKVAETGIIYIDEADKMVVRKAEGLNSRDIRGESVQQAFLKIIEGADVDIEVPDTVSATRQVRINTKNILFIFGGAFEGIEFIVNDRLNRKQKKQLIAIPGLKEQPVVEQAWKVEQEDIIRYGFIKEFVGRVHLVAMLHKLSIEQLMGVLVETNNSVVREFKSMFEADGIKLDFDGDALSYIAEEAHKQDTGARSIRGIMSRWMNPIHYDASQEDVTEVTITKEILKSYNGQS